MSVRYFLLTLLHRKLITTSELKTIIGKYIQNVNTLADKVIDYTDRNKDGFISTGEILYLLSSYDKKIRKAIKGIK